MLANDTDIDTGDVLSVDSVTQGANGAVAIDTLTGGVTYTPDADFNGLDTFVYEIDDGNGNTDRATVTITVNAAPDAPVANDDSYSTNEDVAVSATLGVDDLLQNDGDVDGDTLTVNTTPVSGPSNGALVLNTDGTFTYTPDANFNGTDTFTYTVTDGIQ